jgi:hypothetical protein
MADLENYKIQWKYVPRPWGMEVRFNAVNVKSGNVFVDVLSWRGEKSEPDKAVVEKALSFHLDRCEAALLEREQTEKPVMQEVTKEQVEAYLKKEGILIKEQTLESLAVAMKVS